MAALPRRRRRRQSTLAALLSVLWYSSGGSSSRASETQLGVAAASVVEGATRASGAGPTPPPHRRPDPGPESTPEASEAHCRCSSSRSDSAIPEDGTLQRRAALETSERREHANDAQRGRVLDPGQSPPPPPPRRPERKKAASVNRPAARDSREEHSATSTGTSQLQSEHLAQPWSVAPPSRSPPPPPPPPVRPKACFKHSNGHPTSQFCHGSIDRPTGSAHLSRGGRFSATSAHSVPRNHKPPSPARTREAPRWLRANGGSSAPLDIADAPSVGDPSRSQQYQQLPPPPPPPPPPVPQLTRDSPFAESRGLMQQRQQQQQQTPSSASGPPSHASSGPGITGPAPQRRVDQSFSGRPRIRDGYDDTDASESIMSRLGTIMPSIPRFRMPRFLHLGGSFQEDEAMAVMNLWNAADIKKERRERGFRARIFRWVPGESRNQDQTSVFSDTRKRELRTPLLLQNLVDRFEQGQGLNTALLSKTDRQKGNSIGRKLAVFDLLMLAFAMSAVQILGLSSLVFPRSMSELFSETLQSLSSMLVSSMDTWAPFVMAALFLSVKTSELMADSYIEPFANDISTSIQHEVHCGSLFLRLYKGKPVDRQMSRHIERTVRCQILEKIAVARLRLFVSFLMITFLAMSMATFEPLIKACSDGFVRLLSLPELHEWPVQWHSLLTGMHQTVLESGRTCLLLLKNYFADILNDPKRAAFKLSVMTALIAVAYIPRVEKLRKPKPALYIDEEEFEAAQFHDRFTESLEDLGSSSGSRLCTLSELSGIEIGLERWRLLIPKDMAHATYASAASIIRLMVYFVLSGLILVAPVLILAFDKGVTLALPMQCLQRVSLLEISLLLFMTHSLLRKAIRSAVAARDAEGYVAVFVSALHKALKERLSEKESQTSLEIQAAINPASGLVVKDLWAAHSARRAWAVRGTSFEARNAEIVAIFGEASAGKTRLLTTLAEAIIEPPREALSTNRVRGMISMAGIETNKWDKVLLRRRLGLLLNDVHTLSAVSKALSGMSIEEIIEPSSPRGNPKASRDAMILALKITGLYTSLIPRLPSKVATVVTAVEEDLRSHSLRPRCILLSPVEWSKLLLSRVLAQAIYDNDNPASNGETVDKCLVGSVLILDDVTVNFSDVDEARLLAELRRTGAAIVFASNRWAIGRLVDKIVILKDGAVVESGTHNQLLGRGPQYSLYAAQWHAMATS